MKRNILPIAKYITSKIFIHGKKHKTHDDIFELDFQIDKTGRAIRSAIVYDSKSPKKSSLTIYCEPKKDPDVQKVMTLQDFKLPFMMVNQ